MSQMEIENDPHGRKITPEGVGAWWPTIDVAHDWCGEFREGDSDDTVRRVPQERDLECAGVDPAFGVAE